jgi:hypothetical protein
MWRKGTGLVFRANLTTIFEKKAVDVYNSKKILISYGIAMLGCTVRRLIWEISGKIGHEKSCTK